MINSAHTAMYKLKNQTALPTSPEHPFCPSHPKQPYGPYGEQHTTGAEQEKSVHITNLQTQRITLKQTGLYTAGGRRVCAIFTGISYSSRHTMPHPHPLGSQKEHNLEPVRLQVTFHWATLLLNTELHVQGKVHICKYLWAQRMRKINEKQCEGKFLSTHRGCKLCSCLVPPTSCNSFLF